VVLASIATPITLLVSGLVAWLYKSNNPDNVDITAGLAYLRPILISTFATFGVLMLLRCISPFRAKNAISHRI
jgi:hypothetical protein